MVSLRKIGAIAVAFIVPLGVAVRVAHAYKAFEHVYAASHPACWISDAEVDTDAMGRWQACTC